MGTVAETKGVETGPSDVSAAFALGWQMARLYESPPGGSGTPAADSAPAADRAAAPAYLPGLSALSRTLKTELGLDQADVGIRRLAPLVQDPKGTLSTAATRSELEREPVDANAVRAQILLLHENLLLALTAGDFKLGKAYGLGRALADTCLAIDPSEIPVGETREGQLRGHLLHHLKPGRAWVLRGWLDDLKSALPPHAAEGVIVSLELWVGWADVSTDPNVDTSTVVAALPLDELERSVAALHRCGQRWRAVLSGEKDATDLLQTTDYVIVFQSVLKLAGRMAWSVIKQLAIPLILAAALIAAGLVLMFLNNGTAQVLAGLGTVASGLGLTWRTAPALVARDSSGLRKSMWEAELDVVIGHRLVTDRAWDFIDGGKLNLKDRSFLERALIRERRTEIATQRAGSQEDNRTNG